MLKYIKGHMDSIQGIEVYPIISLIIFFTFFTVLFIWVVTSKKKYIEEVSNIPLELDEETNNQDQ
ncbi:MAG: CcoQ/FixQ family Cbb3-type cytochrome c oxidase assembly chaperone [Flavobacteriaceae bacterium]|nr:CcoQ/FixQ family Cbb3-type cytochrome c oxidase assembly chaperone [Flavobacteriaceae bacterium]|tara:strand:+ start:5821 stop:6015 length:195 start_codon:yes stop_codon:yes gene_type:complete